MALDTGSVPCDLLNNTDTIPDYTATVFNGRSTFEDVWIPSSATVTKALPLIITSGNLINFSDVLTTSRLPPDNAGKMLKTLDPSSKYRLISFLSDGGVAVPVVSGQRDPATAAQRATLATALATQQALPVSSTAAERATAAADVLRARVAAGEAIALVTSYSNLSKILYTNGSKYLSIVDDLFVASTDTATAAATTGISNKTAVTGLGKSTAYTYSGNTSPAFTAITDAQLTTLVSDLQTAKYLLKQSDLYPADAANPTSSSTALISLFQLVAQGTDLDATQKNYLYEFQTRNLRFFASFLAEYCFYRTRYDWFLKQYFKYYTMSETDYGTDTPKNTFYTTFSLSTTADKTQPKLLQQIATQMAKLNTRMVDMKRLLNAINQSYQTIFTNVQTTINSAGATVIGSNANVVAATQALSSSAESAEKYLSDAEFRKGIMDYTSEKNRYSNILLSFYAFLNIAALAAIFQLARS